MMKVLVYSIAAFLILLGIFVLIYKTYKKIASPESLIGRVRRNGF